jgi:tetratricopeptide (TPR) repeat protein
MAESCLNDIAPGSIPRDNQDIEVYVALGLAYAAIGRPDDARAMLMLGREMFREIRHHVMIAATTMAALSQVTIPYRTTDLTERRRLAADAEAAWLQGRGALPETVAPEVVRAMVLYTEGQWQRLLELFSTESMPLIARFPEWTAVLGQVFRHHGARAQAMAKVQQILPEGSSTDPGGQWFEVGNEAQRLAAELALDEADLTAAHAWLEAHDHWLAWSGAVRGQAESHVLWARYHEVAGDPDSARRHAIHALEKASDPVQPLVQLAAHRFLGQIDTQLGQHDDAEEHLSESLTLADACAVPFERALTLLALAELRLAEGKRDEACVLAHEARAICAPLEARPTLVRVDALLRRLGSSRVPGRMRADER